jgi:hypothetical protein
MSIAKPTVYLCLSGLLVFLSACSGPAKPPLDGSVDPIKKDSGSPAPCQFGVSDSGACNGATQLDVDFCDRAWVEVTPEPGILNQDVSVRARAKDPDRNGLHVTWMADPDGTFADAEAATTTFHCTTLGRKTLRMVAVDDRGCDSQAMLEMNCVSPAVGNPSSTADAGTP